jgi:hypothetical protein
MDALSLAMTWKVKLSSHVAVLADGSVRKYLHVDKGMPRDLDVILVEGKGHTINVKSFSLDERYEATDKKALTSDQQEYNDRMAGWAKKCDKESRSRLELVLSDAKTWDTLWGYVALLERNKEISKSNKYFD